jgi:plastocyanin
MLPRPSRVLTGALLLLLATACGGSSKAPAKNSADQTINDGGTVDATGKTTVALTASDFRFSPSTINGTPGQVLQLVVHNTSQTEHNISQSAQHVNTDLDAGDTKTVTLTLPASGRLVFFCEYHASSGMAGSIGPAGSAPPSASPTSSSGSTSGYAPYGGG